MVALIFLFVNLAASLFKSKSRLEACRNERRKFSALLKMLRAGMREQQLAVDVDARLWASWGPHADPRL